MARGGLISTGKNIPRSEFGRLQMVALGPHLRTCCIFFFSKLVDRVLHLVLAVLDLVLAIMGVILAILALILAGR